MPEEKKEQRKPRKPKEVDKSLLTAFNEKKDQTKLLSNVFSGVRDSDIIINGEMKNGKKRSL